MAAGFAALVLPAAQSPEFKTPLKKNQKVWQDLLEASGLTGLTGLTQTIFQNRVSSRGGGEGAAVPLVTNVPAAGLGMEASPGDLQTNLQLRVAPAGGQTMLLRAFIQAVLETSNAGDSTSSDTDSVPCGDLC